MTLPSVPPAEEISMSNTTTSGTIIKVALFGLRLPLTTFERVTGNTDSNWTLAIAYESFEAAAKKILGTLVRDDELIREGTLQRAKVGKLAESEQLETKAVQQRERAEATLEDKQESAERTRLQIERDAREREQEISEEKADKERRTREAARQRKAAANKVSQLRDSAVATEEKRAARARINEESAALAKRRRALSAAKKAQSLETELAATKARRKSS
jgi:hypothetical protein